MVDLTPAEAEALAATHRAAFLDVLAAEHLAAKHATVVQGKRKAWRAVQAQVDQAMGVSTTQSKAHLIWLILLSLLMLWHHPIPLTLPSWHGWIVKPTPVADTTPYHAVLIDDPADFSQAKATAPFRGDPGADAALAAVGTSWAHIGASNPVLAERGYRFSAAELPLLIIAKDGSKTPLYRGPPPADIAALVAKVKKLRGAP